MTTQPRGWLKDPFLSEPDELGQLTIYADEGKMPEEFEVGLSEKKGADIR